MEVIDLFAGPGGWDVGARSLGIDPLGFEWDAAACATREAAGLRTVQGDVAELDPLEFVPAGGHVDGLIASPPCQAFSMAGSGHGRRAIDAFRAAIVTMGRGETVDVDGLDKACEDPRAHLVLEPLRWALALKPRWIAFEQVEPVLPLWEEMAVALRRAGYETWTGVLSAECYGVPQTRRRAILLASFDGPVAKPVQTHQRYVPPRRVEEATVSLFDAPDPERIVAAGERDLLPWVSMAEALGWGMVARPYPVIAGGTGGGPDLEKVGGSNARAAIYDEQRAGRWAGTFRPFGRPTMGGTHEDGEWLPERPPVDDPVFYRNGNQPNAARRREDEPAPTLHFGHALNSGVEWTTVPDEPWRAGQLVDTGCTRGKGEISPTSDRIRPTDQPAPALTTRADQMEWRGEGPPPVAYDSRGQRDGRTGKPNRQRLADEPAPTIAAESRNDSWIHDRPATTVAGDPRIAEPGHKKDEASPGSPGRMTNAVRVTLPEALVLQSFPPDYPVQGTKTKQFEQVGNAVPPLLARAVLASLVSA